MAPSFWNFAGSARNSLISSNSSTASSTPATSANVVFGVSLVTSFAFDFPNDSGPPDPPADIILMMKKNITASRMNGSPV